jgi:hypothetical protein
MPEEAHAGADCWFLEPSLVKLPLGGGIRLDLAHWVEVGAALCLAYLIYLFNTSKAGAHFNNNWGANGLFHAITHFSPSGGVDDDEGAKCKKGGEKKKAAGGGGGGPSTLVVLFVLFLLGGMFCFHPPAKGETDEGFVEGTNSGTKEQRAAHERNLAAEIEAERNSPAAKERAQKEEAASVAQAAAADAANAAKRAAAKAAGGSTECQVCVAVLDSTLALISKPANRKKAPKIAKALTRFCANKGGDLTSKEEKLCYFIGTIKKLVAMPLAVGKDPLFVCKKLSKENAEICQVKF